MLKNVIYQTWPKCGPPNYFCGPWTIFHFENDEISREWSKKFCSSDMSANLVKCAALSDIYIFFNLVKCSALGDIFLKFGPQTKKSGHPCYIQSPFFSLNRLIPLVSIYFSEDNAQNSDGKNSRKS